MRSDVDHYRGLPLWSPGRPEDALALLAPIALDRGTRVLDVGCGRAAVLARLAAGGAMVTGVDRSAAALQAARGQLAAAAPSARATWVQSDLDALAFEDGAFDLVLAIGGPHREGRLDTTFRTYARWLGSGGHLLMGDGFWAAPPPDVYLAETGLERDTFPTRPAYLACAEAQGLRPLSSWTATRSDWERFENTLLENHEAYAEAHPDDPDVRDMIESKRRWHAAQLRHGLDVMGFALDLFERA